MRRTLAGVITAALSLPLALHGQDKPAATSAPATNSMPPTTAIATSTNAAPGAGLVNDWLRQQSPAFQHWDLGGQFRARLEVKDYMATPVQAGQVDFRKNGGDANNTYLLIRQKVHLGYQDDWFNVFVEGQESSSTGDKRNPNLESDLFDLHQGFLALGDLKEFPLQLKAGRQELSYGGERLIGAFDWNNIGRVFDAIKLRYATGGVWVDAFVSHVVIPRDNSFDYPNNYDTFSGVYGSSSTLVPWEETQLYFLARNTGTGSPNLETGALVPLPSPRDIYTIGFRVKSLPGKLPGWDYDAEADYQFGRYVAASGTAPNAVIGKSMDQEAYAAHVDAGYTWAKVPGSPRVGLEFNYASGDNNPNDNKHRTFDTLYPTTHLFAGIMDFYSWQNIEDARINFSLKPMRKVTANASYRGLWLANTSDSFYQANTAPRTGGTVGGHNGYAINPSYGSFVGTEADLVVTYAPTSYAAIQAGYGHFFVGNYVKESLSAPGFGSTDANYFYLQTRLNF